MNSNLSWKRIVVTISWTIYFAGLVYAIYLMAQIPIIFKSRPPGDPGFAFGFAAGLAAFASTMILFSINSIHFVILGLTQNTRNYLWSSLIGAIGSLIPHLMELNQSRPLNSYVIINVTAFYFATLTPIVLVFIIKFVITAIRKRRQKMH